MKWPWSPPPPPPVVAPPNEFRGTVHLFNDGTAIIGLPKGVSSELAYRANAGLERWLNTNGQDGPLLLPFPVDITDKRVIGE